MLPSGYQIPAGVFLVLGGLLACFAGYRLFRIVLGVYGFMAGAFIGSSFVAASNQTAMLVAAGVGGLIGAIALYAAYFLGVVIVGAGLGAFVAHVVWPHLFGDPGVLVLIVAAIVGAFAAWGFQRMAVIIATAVGGAWTAVSGGIAVAATQLSRRPPKGGTDMWIQYPTSLPPGQRWVLAVWAVVALAGLIVQLRGGKRGGKAGKKR